MRKLKKNLKENYHPCNEKLVVFILIKAYLNYKIKVKTDYVYI